MPDAAPLLAPWKDFYVIIGSAGASLTGLMFVVITLIRRVQTTQTSQQIDAFGTPTIVHFCAALLLAGTLTAPWPGLPPLGLTLGCYGAAGVGYGAVVTRRARRQEGYAPVLEDWLFHSALPIAAYATLAAAGVALRGYPAAALSGVATAAIVLLFVGIHNSWDTLTYITTEKLPRQDGVQAPQPAPQDAAAPGA